MLNITMEFMADLLGKSVTELQTALKSEDGDPKVDQNEIQTYLKTEFAEKFEAAKIAGKVSGKREGKGFGKREALDEVEAKLAEKMKVEKGPIETMIEAYSARVMESSEEITEDQVKHSPFFQEAIKAERLKIQAVSSEFDAYKGEVSMKDQKKNLKGSLLDVLKKKNYRLPEDKKLLDSRLDLLVSQLLSKAKFDGEKSDSIKVLDPEDGSPIQDELFNNVAFSDWVLPHANLVFDISDGDGRQSPQNQTQPSSGSGNFTFPSITTNAQFFDEFEKIEDLDKKEAFKKHFDNLVAGGKILE